jgi:hypothetical protein
MCVGLAVVYLMIGKPNLVESLLLTGVALTLGLAGAMVSAPREAKLSAVGVQR